MSEKKKATLCLVAIAALIAFAQTADYHDQQQAAAPSSDYIEWHREMLAATQDTWTREERDAYVSRWKQENPELARIVNTQWHESKSQKVAQK